MLRPAARSLQRPQLSRHFLPRHPRTAAPRRTLITPPAHRSRSWKNGAARWGLALGAVYWYTTSDIFAEGASYDPQQLLLETSDENEQLPTIEALASRRSERRAAMGGPQSLVSDTPGTSLPQQTASAAVAEVAPEGIAAGPESPEELEEEAEAQGAFNEETGEINWDCPCLGGMAHGPCGPEFREAFSCFVYSKEEPKGVDCIDRFKNMQDCFRQHPDVYGAELTDEPEEGEEYEARVEEEMAVAPKGQDTATSRSGISTAQSSSSPSSSSASSASSASLVSSTSSKAPSDESKSVASPTGGDDSRADEKSGSSLASVKETVKDTVNAVTGQSGASGKGTSEALSESDELVPKAAHDARDPK